MRRITAPTLIAHGTVDTLFTPQEAVANYRLLHDAGVPTKMAWVCGGHGVCLTEPGRGSEHALRQTRRWLAKHLEGRDVRTGPGFWRLDQHGNRHTAKS